MKLVERVYRLDSKKLLNAINKRSDVELHDFHQPESFKTLAEYLTAAGVDFDQTKSLMTVGTKNGGTPIHPSLRTVYSSDRAVGILILTTASMSSI
jgi:hypothetical protein